MNSDQMAISNCQVSSVILEAANLIGKSLEPHIVIHDILKLLSDKLGLLKGRIVVPSEKGNELAIRYSYGLTPHQAAQGKYAVGEGITGTVMKTGKIAIIPDINKEPNYLARIQSFEVLECSSISFVAVPIFKEDQPIGVLAVNPRLKHHATFMQDMQILQVVAAMIGQVLHINDLIKEKTNELVQENRKLKNVYNKSYTTYGILGQSLALETALNRARRAAASQATVMLMGESGVGKERFARMIHLSSQRRDQPFVCINCASIPENLLESELFGHEKGSFTGATATRRGKFELAGGGTLFLDEIGDLNLDLQVKLLRVLQEKTIQRIGGNKEIPIDVRIITATHKNLQEAVNSAQFRLDLYYRLNVIRIHLPPLRDREGDIRLLATYFMNRESQRHGRNLVLSPSALAKLEEYDWPGNIRQLENLVERIVIMTEKDYLTDKDLATFLDEEASITVISKPVHHTVFSHPSEESFQSTMNARPYSRINHQDKDMIKDAIRRSNGNKTVAAQILGMTVRQLHYRVEKLGIDITRVLGNGNFLN